MATDDEIGDMLPVHPGRILLEEFMMPLGLAVRDLALALALPPDRVDAVISGRHGIDAETALRLARYFGTDAQSWMNLQSNYELELAARALADRLQAEITPRAA